MSVLFKFSGGPNRFLKDTAAHVVFKHICTPVIRNIIIKETNRRAQTTYRLYNEAHPDNLAREWVLLDDIEFDAFIGLLLFSGVRSQNMQPISKLWKPSGFAIFRATMSRDRFALISRFIRFDNNVTRVQRLAQDKAAPIRDIWSLLNVSLAENYYPHTDITVVVSISW